MTGIGKLTSRSGWRVEAIALDRGHGTERLIRVTYRGAPQGFATGLPRGYFRTIADVTAECPYLPWDELEEP